MPTITDYVAPATTESVRSTLYASAEIVALKITSWAAGAVARTIFAVVAPVIRAFADVNTEAIKGGILDFAGGAWLDALGEGVYQTSRNDAAFAGTTVTFTNPTPDLYDFDAGDVVVSRGTQGPTYRTTGPLHLEPGGTDDVDVVAEVIGTDSDAAAGEIDTLVTSIPGVTCTNDTAALGSDREEDDPYRERCRIAPSATSPMGAQDAYRYVATSARREDGTSYGITKVGMVGDDTAGTVGVILATVSGAPDAGDVTELDAILLEKVVPHGIEWLGAAGATEVEVDIEATVYARASDGLSEDEIIELAETAVDELFEEWPIAGLTIPPAMSGALIQDEIRAVISQAQAAPSEPKPIKKVTLVAPAADVPLAEDEVAVLGDVDITVVFI